MGLKQHIVVVNEYTTPKPSGNGGSRGGTPGNYILQYMVREGATETVAPIQRRRVDTYIERYMAREDAVESVGMDELSDLKPRMKRKGQGKGGVAFGYGDSSLSDESLRAASKDIQEHFDNGHTVMKTIISFDEEYLKHHGLVDPDFQLKKRGDYRGHLDQLKLRMAIMRGLERMGRLHYDDLRYVGLIQVDTKQVHCHLAMVDAGSGTVMPDGTQRGKLSQDSMSLLRRGIDAYLDEHQFVKHLSSAVGYERRNVASYVKRWAHEQMTTQALPQFLLATLPEDRRLWRSGTNRQEMAKPNRIVREMVEDVLDQPNSPMGSAMQSVQDYADGRREQEPEMEHEDYERLIAFGQEQIYERATNAVYATLRQLPEDMLRVRTPMLDAMGMDYRQMAQRAKEREDDDLIGFGFRLRSFSMRRDHHEEERDKHHQSVRSWEARQDQSSTPLPSWALYDFYAFEEEYHAQVAAKYRSFLPYVSSTDEWYQRWQDVEDYGKRLLSLESMRNDASLKKMRDPDEAERLGRMIYGQAGGHYVSLNDADSRQVLADRVTVMRSTYDRKVDDLRTELSRDGLVLDLVPGDQDTGVVDVATIEHGDEYDFEDVKGLDLHGMRYDFSTDVEVGPRTRRRFIETARQREYVLHRAMEYLEGSKQAAQIQKLPVDDVSAMVQMADVLEAQPEHETVLMSSVAQLVREQQLARRSATIQLSEPLAENVEQSVRAGVRRYRFDPTSFEQDTSASERGTPAVSEPGDA